jgi:hypothetical protein
MPDFPTAAGCPRRTAPNSARFKVAQLTPLAPAVDQDPGEKTQHYQQRNDIGREYVASVTPEFQQGLA